MNIDEILEEMDELLDKSSSVPFMSHKKIIDSERLRELINDVRLNMPAELSHAKQIEFDSQQILNKARANAETIIQKAKERAETLVSQEAIVLEARKKAVDMITKAQATTKSLQSAVVDSINKMLTDTEETYTNNLKAIKAVKSKVSSAKK